MTRTNTRMNKQKKRLSERIVDSAEEEQLEDFQTAEAEEGFGFKEDEIELLSALRHKKKSDS